MGKKICLAGLLLSLFLAGFWGTDAGAQQDVKSSYKGATMKFLVPYAAGGSYDLWARMLAPSIEKQTGANVLVENMPGAAGLMGGGYLYSVAKPDGLSIMIQPITFMAFAEMLEFEEVKYEMDKFSYICRVEVPDRAMVVSNASGFKSIADMQKATKSIRFASISANSQNSVESSLIIEAFGLKGKIIAGYKGQPEYMLALMAGREVDVALGNIANIIENVKKGELTLVSIEGDQRHPAFPKIPFLLEEAGIKPAGKKLLEVLTIANGAGRMIIAPPAVPEPRRLFLEQVILNAMKEPAFIAWAKKNEFNLSSLPGKECKEMIVKLKDLVPKAERAKMKEVTQKYL